MMPESIKKTRNASITLSFFGVLSTYELYSVESGDCADADDEVEAEVRDLAAAEVDAFAPLGGMVGSLLLGELRSGDVDC